MAADWTFTPHYVYEIEHIDPPTLVTAFEDGSLSVRSKHTTRKRLFTERYREPGATIKAMFTELDTHGLDNSFIKISYDPNATTPPADEITVYLVSYGKVEQIAFDLYEVTFQFREA